MPLVVGFEIRDQWGGGVVGLSGFSAMGIICGPLMNHCHGKMTCQIMERGLWTPFLVMQRLVSPSFPKWPHVWAAFSSLSVLAVFSVGSLANFDYPLEDCPFYFGSIYFLAGLNFFFFFLGNQTFSFRTLLQKL